MISPETIVPWLALTALKASLLLGAAFVVTALLRGASAATRHLVWLAAFVGVLALPVVGTVVPSLRLPMGPLNQLVPVAEPTAGMAGGIAAGVVAGVADAARKVEGPQPIVLQGRAGIAELDGRYRAVESRNMSPELRAKIAGMRRVLEEARKHPAHFVAVGGFTPAVSSPVWPMRVFLVWVFGCVMVAVAFAVGVLRTHVVACTALPANGDLLSEEVEVLSASLGIVRDVKLVTCAGPAMPMTWGALHPVVLLPEDARSWPADRRRQVLTHELAHVRRGDWLARLIAAAACAIHWFNPLVWMASRQLRDEQELACDDTVLAGGVQPSDYAAHLLEVARALRVPSFAMANTSVAMARPSQLTGRLLAVLDETRSRVAVAPRRTAGLASLIALAVVVTVAAATPAAARPKAWTVFHAEPAVAAALSATAPSIPAAIQQATAAASYLMPDVDCWENGTSAGTGRGRGRGGSSSSSSGSTTASSGSTVTSSSSSGRGSSHSSTSVSDDGLPNRVTLSLSDGNCKLEMRVVGTAQFNDDETDIIALSQGGTFRITEEGNGPDRRLDVTNQDGRLVRRWRVDGSDVQETPELRAWLAQALTTVMTRTGYDIVPRTMRAYRAGGTDSVLSLSQATSSDYARRTMLQALLDSVRVPAGDAARIARQAADMSSDYEKAELLITVARKLPLDAAVQDAMVDAASSMSSDYERHRVLSAALARRDLSTDAAQKVLQSAASMSSDYEKAELLIEFGRGRDLSQTMQTGFLAATNSMSSDYERRRVLADLLAHAEASPALAPQLCSQAARLSSDYERAELLVQMARKFGGNADARSCIRRAADGMSSDYEKDRVLAAVGRATQ